MNIMSELSMDLSKNSQQSQGDSLSSKKEESEVCYESSGEFKVNEMAQDRKSQSMDKNPVDTSLSESGHKDESSQFITNQLSMGSHNDSSSLSKESDKQSEHKQAVMKFTNMLASMNQSNGKSNNNKSDFDIYSTHTQNDNLYVTFNISISSIVASSMSSQSSFDLSHLKEGGRGEYIRNILISSQKEKTQKYRAKLEQSTKTVQRLENLNLELKKKLESYNKLKDDIQRHNDKSIQNSNSMNSTFLKTLNIQNILQQYQSVAQKYKKYKAEVVRQQKLIKKVKDKILL